ncbi:hypothetical protein C9374_007062 [Naegleria lovaniensis]|uniref:Uncharacterized protein n=1 Tax=Naegleria lovaniensis TaxID=51637 RepID=A0AA88KRR6_NAELO|nr:uncharacterized protein C9374_007062 [Naegleria lovaniensis]KAG2393531.1 hypothetical protein C9374_007062 [Naegleria lovaniensis]
MIRSREDYESSSSEIGSDESLAYSSWSEDEEEQFLTSPKENNDDDSDDDSEDSYSEISSKKLKTFHHDDTSSECSPFYSSENSNSGFYGLFKEASPKSGRLFKSNEADKEEVLVGQLEDSSSQEEPSCFYMELINPALRHSHQSKISYFSNFMLKNTDLSNNIYAIAVDGRRAFNNEKKKQIKYVFHFSQMLLVMNEEYEIFAAKIAPREILSQSPVEVSQSMKKAMLYLCADEKNRLSSLNKLGEIVAIQCTSGAIYVVTKRKVFYATISRQCPYKKDDGTSCKLLFDSCLCEVDEDDYFIDAAASCIDHLIFLTKNNIIYSTGWNSTGMLGNGTTVSHYNIVSKVRTTPHEQNDTVRMLCCGPLTSMYVTDTHVYAAGEIGLFLNPPKQSTSSVFVPLKDLPFKPSSITSINHGEICTCFLIGRNTLWIYWSMGKKQMITMPENFHQFYPSMTNVIYSLHDGKNFFYHELVFELDGNALNYHEKEWGECDERCFNNFISHQSEYVVLFHIDIIFAREMLASLYNATKLDQLTDIVVKCLPGD